MSFAALAVSFMLAAAPPQSAAPTMRAEATPPKLAAVAVMNTTEQRLTRLERALADVDRQIEDLKTDVDKMSGMSELDALRLQAAMDRMSKLQSTLSNLLKKMSDTQSAIAQNLK